MKFNLLFPAFFLVTGLLIAIPSDRDLVSSAHAQTALSYPQTEAILFYQPNQSEKCIDTLASFDYLRFGLVASSEKQGDNGVNLGRRPGIGNWASTAYNFNDMGDGFLQKTILSAKALNPDLRVFSHAGLRNVPTNIADNDTNHPRRWFFDALSPRWFAYTMFADLQASVDNSALVFEVTARDVERMRKLGVQSAEELRLNPTKWIKRFESKYSYFQGFDNNQGSGPGTKEIMAFGKIEVKGDRGIITAMTRPRQIIDEKGKKKTIASRAIWGKPSTNTYKSGARFGLLSNAEKDSYGSHVFAMNLVCANLNNGTPFCREVNKGGSWSDHVVGYVRDILLPSKAGGVYLNDGITFDADENRQWKSYSFKFTGDTQPEQRLDMDGDGHVDSVESISAALYGTYDYASRRMTEEAKRQGRPDFFLVMNGALATEHNGQPVVYDEGTLDGREWEQFFNVFTDNGTLDAIDQYRRLYTGLIEREHPVALLTSRERTSLETKRKINVSDFRAVAAIGLIFGDGAIGVTGNFDSTFATCGNRKGPDTWMDEFAVDANGVAATRRTYKGPTRHEHRHWLGQALGTGEEITGMTNTFKREFENGIAYYSIPGGVIPLAQPMNKICGTDPVNDCSKNLTEITLQPGEGLILLRP